METKSFFFVAGRPSSNGERKLGARQARAHTARVNKSKRDKLMYCSAIGAAADERTQSSRTQTPESVDHSAVTETQCSSVGQHVFASTASREDEESKISRQEQAASPTCRGQNHPDDAMTSVSLPRTISPFLGASTTNTFMLGHSERDVASVTDYWINVIWPNIFLPDTVISAWFTAFCECPLIFHSMSWVIAVHHDIFCNRLCWTISKKSLFHKVQALSLLKTGVSEITSDNASLALFAVLLLAALDSDQDHLNHCPVFLFDPHMPAANWLSIYGRMEKPIEPHANAVHVLLELLGGLENVKLPGVDWILTSQDLLLASQFATRPSFPCVLNSASAEVVGSKGFPHLREQTLEGSIFSQCPLTPDLISVLDALSVIDSIMSRCRIRKVKDEGLSKLIGARDSAQHRLISSPSWNELDEDTRASTCRQLYECTRLTAIIYSNAVVYAYPPHSGWHIKLVAQLAIMLDESNWLHWTGAASKILTWILVIGGMASFNTPSASFFEATFTSHLARRPTLTSKEAVCETVRNYLWSDAACERGFETFWNAIRVLANCTEYD